MRDASQDPIRPISASPALTPREVEVLDLTSLGMTNAGLAAQLGISVHAVKFHLASVYRKLAVANRTEAVAAYIRSTQLDNPKARGDARDS